MDLFEYQGKQYCCPTTSRCRLWCLQRRSTKRWHRRRQPAIPAWSRRRYRSAAAARPAASSCKRRPPRPDARLEILGMDIKGHVVKRVWVERASDIAEEYYASFTLDRGAKKHLLMLSSEGGVEIESVAVSNPDAIVMRHINPVDGLSPAEARQACVDARLNPKAVDGAAEILVKLYRCFTEGDCDLAEINPLILRPDGGVHALDAKVSLDNNAAFRHPEWDEYRATEELDEREKMAREHDLQYIGLEGTVGIIANGAGWP